MTFTLKIELGNDAMESLADVGAMVGRLADRLKRDHSEPGVGDGGKLIDINGNTVGKWEVVS